MGQLLEILRYNPADHLQEWVLVIPVAISLVVWSAITLILLISPHRNAWKITEECTNAMQCKFLIFLLPWGILMIPMGIFVLFASSNGGQYRVEDFLLRVMIVIFAIAQALTLAVYHFGSHQHK